MVVACSPWVCLRDAIGDCELEPVEFWPPAVRAVGAWPTSALRVCVIASTARPDGRLDRPRWLREFFNGLPGLYPPAGVFDRLRHEVQVSTSAIYASLFRSRSRRRLARARDSSVIVFLYPVRTCPSRAGVSLVKSSKGGIDRPISPAILSRMGPRLISNSAPSGPVRMYSLTRHPPLRC